jgi:hypothetical protein
VKFGTITQKSYLQLNLSLLISYTGDFLVIINILKLYFGARGGAVVEALRYKPEGCGIDSRWCYWNFSAAYTFRLHSGPGSTQLPTEMSTRNISWGKGGQCVGLTTLPPSCADCLKKNLETSNSWKTQSLSSPVIGLLYVYLYLISAYDNFCDEKLTVYKALKPLTVTSTCIRGINWE